jgi:CheY-like chemotaxis protein
MTDTSQSFAAQFPNSTDPAAGEHRPESPAEPVAESKYTVLAIDDDPAFLHTVTSVLRKHGFDVLTSTTGTKGLNMLRYSPQDISVVLLDYSMPQLNGAETLSYLRKLCPKAKVIALTAIDLNQLPKSFCDGVDTLIQKPFDARKVIDAIRSLIGVEAQPATSTPNQN